MGPTRLLYLEDMHRLEAEAAVQVVLDLDDGRTAVLLDQTVFYPQGGGQPSDMGVLEAADARFEVQDVRLREGIVYHIGRFETGRFEPGQTVRLRVDAGRRRLHDRLHSAGHLIDVALRNLGWHLVPGKGYHFPDGPYVEYMGVLPKEDEKAIRQRLEAECNRLIQTGSVVTVRFVAPDEVETLCGYVPDYIPREGPVRVVFVAGPLGCPCGGTHVRDIREIGRLRILKVRVSGGRTRVRYAVED